MWMFALDAPLMLTIPALSIVPDMIVPDMSNVALAVLVKLPSIAIADSVPMTTCALFSSTESAPM